MKWSNSTPVRSHSVSAGIAGLYVLMVHVAVYASFAVAYLLGGGTGLGTIVAPLSTMIVGLVVFFIIKTFPTERVTFYVTLLIGHIALSALFVCTEKLFADSMIHALQQAVGIVLTGQPEENYDGLALLLIWLFLALGMGLFYFLAAVVSLVRAELRRVMGYVPKEKKNRKEDPKT